MKNLLNGPVRKNLGKDGWHVVGDGLCLPMKTERECDIYVERYQEEQKIAAYTALLQKLQSSLVSVSTDPKFENEIIFPVVMKASAEGHGFEGDLGLLNELVNEVEHSIGTEPMFKIHPTDKKFLELGHLLLPENLRNFDDSVRQGLFGDGLKVHLYIMEGTLRQMKALLAGKKQLPQAG